jgi:6-phosphogluconolactonase
MKPEIRRYPNLETLSRGAAEYLCILTEESVPKKGVFTVALAGGKTPELLYETLAHPPFDARIPWPQVHFFWGDERCVPPDHPDSNFGMASRALISRVPVLPQNVHRIPGEAASPAEAAEEYEKTLREFFGRSIEGSFGRSPSAEGRQFPSFDFVMLGMGKDGHTASLFPGDPVLKEKERWVASVGNPCGSPLVPRVTLTLPAINRARCVMFLVSGVEKQDVIRLIMDDPETANGLYPAARVQPEGRLLWFLDEQALPRE